MKFDVIIGNPPYQLGSKNIYPNFIKNAIDMAPKYFSFIVPGSLASGAANDKLRKEFFKTGSLTDLVFYKNGKDCFKQGYTKNDGIVYFLYKNGVLNSLTQVSIFGSNQSFSQNMLNSNFWNTDYLFYSILNKITEIEGLNYENWSSLILTPDYKIPTNVEDIVELKEEKEKDFIKIYLKHGKIRYINKYLFNISKSKLNKENKLIISESHCANFNNGKILPKIIEIEKNSVISDTYRILYSGKKNLNNVKKYAETKFFRYLLSILKKDQHNNAGMFKFIPLLDMNEDWTDEKLYKRYNLTQEEIDYIEEKISPME